MILMKIPSCLLTVYLYSLQREKARRFVVFRIVWGELMCATSSGSDRCLNRRITDFCAFRAAGAEVSECLFTVIFLVSFVAQHSVAQTYSARVLQDDPIFYWTLDDADLSDVPTNLGGSDLDAIYSGSIELGQDGLVPGEPANKSARFGSGSRLEVPDHVDIDDTPMAKKSWSLWFNADDVNSDSPQMLFEQGGNTRGAAIYVQNGQLFAGVWNNADDDGGISSPWLAGDGDLQATIYLSAPVVGGVTNHVALVMDGSDADTSGTVSAYLNGQLIGSETGAGQLFPHNPSNIGVCTADCRLQSGNFGGGGSEFSGRIDEVALFNSALSGDQILAHLDVDFPMLGDFNGDDQVSLADFTILAENFNRAFDFPAALSLGDVDGNNVVDMSDFAEWRTLFATQSAGAAAIPEPPTWSAMLFGLSLLPVVRRLRKSK